MARPVVEIDYAKLEAYLQCKANKSMCASLLGVSEDTIEKRVKEKYDMTFSELANDKMAVTKIKLVQVALNKAFKGDNCMLIFCLKNVAGWKDNPDVLDEPLTDMEF